MDTGEPVITIATYNVLAAKYVRPEYYPKAEPRHLEREARYPTLVERVAALACDVLCLQEVDAELYGLLRERLATLGYDGAWACKHAKPDGCATFVRGPWKGGLFRACPFADERVAGTASGHLALVAHLPWNRRILAVVNTHLRWAPADTPPERHYGFVQAFEALALATPYAETVICGDFNAEPDSPLLEHFKRFGFADAHPPDAATHAAHGRACKIDFLLHAPTLEAEPLPTPRITDESVLPSADEPSDHLPLRAAFHPKR